MIELLSTWLYEEPRMIKVLPAGLIHITWRAENDQTTLPSMGSHSTTTSGRSQYNSIQHSKFNDFYGCNICPRHINLFSNLPLI